MDDDGPLTPQLSRDDCMRLVGSVSVGRIVYTRQALPAVELVNFALVGGDIVIRTVAEGKLAAAMRGAIVAFEADSVDIDRHTGWSVTVVGQAREVTESAEIRSLERAVPPSWVTGEQDHFIRVSPAIVNGLRVSSEPLTGQASARHL